MDAQNNAEEGVEEIPIINAFEQLPEESLSVSQAQPSTSHGESYTPDAQYSIEEEALLKFEADHTLTPDVTAKDALYSILKEEPIDLDEQDTQLDPYSDTQYLESLYIEKIDAVANNRPQAEVNAAIQRLEIGKDYLAYRAEVAQAFYADLINAKQNVGNPILIITEMPTSGPITQIRVLKCSVAAWANTKLNIQINKWSKGIRAASIPATPNMLNAIKLSRRARISIHITLALMARLLAEENPKLRSQRKADYFSGKEIAKKLEKYVQANYSEGSIEGHGAEMIRKRIKLGNDLLKETQI